MTLVGPIDVARPVRGPLIVRLGIIGLVGAAMITVVAWLLTEDLFSRFGDSLEVTGEALHSVGLTLDVADDALGTLTLALDTTATATAHAAASSETVAEAVTSAAAIVGEELPASVEAIRAAMPGLIEASNVIDNTLSGLSLIGVPYNPGVPLDEAFSNLDRQLAPLPDALRQNAAVISALVPEAEGFHDQTELLTTQVELMRGSVDQARDIIDQYRTQALRFDSVVAETSEDLDRSTQLARLLVVMAGASAMVAMCALIVAGRAISALEELPR